MAELADEVHVDPAILAYVSPHRRGVAPAPVASSSACRCAAASPSCAAPRRGPRSQGRTYVVPDDIKLLAEPVLCHRLLLDAEAQFAGMTVDQVIDPDPRRGRAAG